MCEKGAVIEYLKHFAANLLAGIMHGLIGFSIALIIASFIPVQIPVNNFTDLILFSFTVGAGSGILGSILAVEKGGGDFKAGRVLKFVRKAAYPENRSNGKAYTISRRFNLSIHRKKSWQDYIFYV